MSRHAGTAILVVAAIVSLTVALAFVLPEMRSAERIRARVLAANVGALEKRLDVAPERDVARVAEFDRMLEEVFKKGIGEGGEGGEARRIRQMASVFADDLDAWRRARHAEGILAQGAWPAGPVDLPTVPEMRRTVDLAALVEALGRRLRERAGGHIGGVRPDRNEVDITFEPERAGVLVDALTALGLGGTPFEIEVLDITVPERAGGEARLRVRWPPEEP